MCLLLICIKGKLVLLLDKTGYVSQETRPNFINSQNVYFHFHYKLFCIKAVHLSVKLSLMCPRLWPIEHICFRLYVLERLLKVRYILEKVMSMQHSFEEFSEKQRRVELKSVGNFVAKTVLVESPNHFYWKSYVGQRTAWNIFRSHIDHQTLWKNFNQLIEFIIYTEKRIVISPLNWQIRALVRSRHIELYQAI